MQALARGWATTVVTACAKGIAWSVWRWWMVWCSSKWWHMQHPMEKSFPTTISLSGGDRSFGDDLFESRYCKCWEYPLWYDSLRFILCFSVCCPLLSAFLINLCYWQFLAPQQLRFTAPLRTASHRFAPLRTASHRFTQLHTASHITNWFFSCITTTQN